MQKIISLLCLLCLCGGGCRSRLTPDVPLYYRFDRPTRQPAFDVDMRGIPAEWDDAQAYVSC